ncbi:MAG: site-specific integrase, partial [Propionicimonas sp.]
MLRGDPVDDRRHGPSKGASRRGFGRLRRERSGRWTVAYTGPDGVLYGHPGTLATEDAARGWLAAERKLIDLDAWTPPTERDKVKRQRGETFKEYSTKWLAGRKTSRGEPLKPRTVSEYQRYLDRHLWPAFGDLPVKSLRAATVQEWYDDLGTATPTERAHCYQLLRAICATAVETKVLPANPCQIKGAGQVRPAKRMEPATLVELEKITAEMPERLRLAVLLGSWCALRYGEVAELRRGDIDLANAVVNVSRGVTWPNGVATVGTPKSLAGNRPVDIP